MAGKWSASLENDLFISTAYNLNADVASVAADRADELQANLHGKGELLNRARRS